MKTTTPESHKPHQPRAHDAAPFTPYVPADKKIPEFTITAVVLGFILSIVFNAANAYLGLKIGLTVAASIPSSIISMGVLRMILPKLIGRSGTILENNIVHTIASTGESLAAAIIFTVPALIFLGGTVSNSKVLLLGAAGGLLGMLMMIPLRQSLVVHEHDNLPFPEGNACAKVLIAGDQGGANAKPVFTGILTGAVFKFAMSGLTLFKESLMWTSPKLNKAGFGYEVSPLLVGVGYLIGLRITMVMLAGGLLGYWVLIPLINALGGDNVIAPGVKAISAMSTSEIRSTYVRYIGAGGVAFGGLISLVKSLPDIMSSLKHSLAALSKARAARGSTLADSRDWEEKPIVVGAAILGVAIGFFAGDGGWGPADLVLRALYGVVGAAVCALIVFYCARATAPLSSVFKRTEHDLPLPVTGLGVGAMFLLLWLHPAFELGFLESVIVVLFCFFFVAVSARMVGLIGTTNQPVSGMTITALLTMTLLFVWLGHDSETVRTAAIMGGAAVCIAISLSGDLSQDLKTAALVGGTPWKVQLAEILGTLVSAVRTGFILLLLYKAYGFGAPTPEHPNPLEAPQSQLMAKLVSGATGGELPWTLLLTGAGIGIVAELCGVSALALAIGLYLPITNWPMMVLGGLLAWYVAKQKGQATEEGDEGSLYASGLIAGDALMGIGLAMLAVAGVHWNLREPEAGVPWVEALIATGLYGGICFALYRYGLEKKRA